LGIGFYEFKGELPLLDRHLFLRSLSTGDSAIFATLLPKFQYTAVLLRYSAIKR